MITSASGAVAAPVAAANPCISCGACCSFFRASFHWMETDAGGGTVPAEMTRPLTHHRVVMRGTERSGGRCVALTGEIGSCVGCTIHPLRSSVCRDFEASWENGVHNVDCDRARARHGLPPLEPGWNRPGDDSPTSPFTDPAPGRRAA